MGQTYFVQTACLGKVQTKSEIYDRSQDKRFLDLLMKVLWILFHHPGPLEGTIRVILPEIGS